jgi:predicted HD phosphohydrolase
MKRFSKSLLPPMECPAKQVLVSKKGAWTLRYGKDVTELQHVLQLTECGRPDSKSGAIVLACLPHDYGIMLQNRETSVA